MSEVSQPNEQLIETIEKALRQSEKVPSYRDHVANNADYWLRALLKQNKRLKEELAEERYSFGALEHANIDNLMELEQTRGELERSRGSHMFQYGLSLELEIKRLKAELEKVAPSTMATWTHDCLEVNDNYGFQVVARGKKCPFCGKTEASQ